MKKHLRVLGLTLFEAHLTNQSSGLVAKTLGGGESLIRNVRYVWSDIKEQGPRAIIGTEWTGQDRGHSNLQDRGSRLTPEMGTPAMELDFWWEDRNKGVNL